ncbi:hypothetical protein J1614_000775 [Plenodomus biglobosus]|nr:hypothetical protein J1614_000775 [Plenodomus biglobosus]
MGGDTVGSHISSAIVCNAEEACPSTCIPSLLPLPIFPPRDTVCHLDLQDDPTTTPGPPPPSAALSKIPSGSGPAQHHEFRVPVLQRPASGHRRKQVEACAVRIVLLQAGRQAHGATVCYWTSPFHLPSTT